MPCTSCTKLSGNKALIKTASWQSRRCNNRNFIWDSIHCSCSALTEVYSAFHLISASHTMLNPVFFAEMLLTWSLYTLHWGIYFGQTISVATLHYFDILKKEIRYSPTKKSGWEGAALTYKKDEDVAWQKTGKQQTWLNIARKITHTMKLWNSRRQQAYR